MPFKNVTWQSSLFTAFKLLIAIVLIGKLANWFFHFDTATNRWLNVAMFVLIGISYLVMGFIWNNIMQKWILLTCGVYLIVMHFLGTHFIWNLLGIICLIIPMVIGKWWQHK